MVESGRILAYGGRLHGNGKPPTRSEAEMFKRLRDREFQREFVVRTGTRSPSHYKIDLAQESVKLAIEIDGSSHGAKRRIADARKTSFLESKGWTVLRFPEPLNYVAVEREIRSRVSTMAMSST